MNIAAIDQFRADAINDNNIKAAYAVQAAGPELVGTVVVCTTVGFPKGEGE